MKRLYKVGEVSNKPTAGVAAKMRFELLPGFRYYLAKARFYGGAAVKPFDAVESIKILKGSGSGDNVQLELTPAELNEHNSLFSPDKYGAIVEGGGNIDTPGEVARLTIMFLDPERSQFIAQERTVLDLVNESAFIELGFTDDTTAGVYGELLVLAEPLNEVLADINAGRSAPLNVLPDGRSLFMIGASTSKVFNANFVEVSDLARDREYFALHLYNPVGAAITEVIAKINEVDVWNATKADIDDINRTFDLHPVAGRTSIIPDLVGKTSDAWNLNGIAIGKFKLRVNFSASVNSNLKIVSFRYGQPL
jgi:hypothetical protein